jgi:pimeloyl-ACP methyl ester carboxylesterase
VPVVAVPAGSSSASLPTAGQSGYLSIEHVAFRRFGSGKDLLLVMGQDGTMAWWEPSLLSLLAHHYTVTIFDLPGVGYSQAATVPVTLSWLADETAGLIQALSLGHPTVVGWGLGGDVALALAERHPSSLGSLVLVDTSAGGSGAVRPARAISALLNSPWATAASLASTIFGSSVAGSSRSFAAEASAWVAIVRLELPDEITQAGLDEERAVQLDVWSSELLAESTDSVSVPSLVAFGADDAVVPASDGAQLALAIPGAQTVTFPGTGYASMFEDPSVFVASLERFTR